MSLSSQHKGSVVCVAIADDLTGALEVGGHFADSGLASEVFTEARARPYRGETSVLVFDAETRHVPPAQAFEHTRKIARLATECSPELIYKKTDSTLRGNIAAELRAVQQVFSAGPIVYAPAYPDLGRIVKHGRLLVHGIPVHETEFANDPWSPVRDCRVQGVLGGVKAVVLDGESNADIDAAAERILQLSPPRVCAGPSALASALARKLGSRKAEQRMLPRVKKCLIVNGSLHPVSKRQIAGAAVQNVFDQNWKLLAPEVEGTGRARAFRVGECVRTALQAEAFDALIVFGGDTAFGICSALDVVAFEPIGEVTPGVALSRGNDLLWITKAGGFGPDDILAVIRRRLT